MIQATVLPSHLVLTEADPGAPGQTQEQSLVDDSHIEAEIKPQLKHRDSMAKEEDPNASHQLYKWQVKSRRSTVSYGMYKRTKKASTKENKLALAPGGGHWRQKYTAVRPD